MKDKSEKKVENEESTGVRNDNSTGVCFTKTKTMINGISKSYKDPRSLLENVTNKPAKIQQDWGSFRR